MPATNEEFIKKAFQAGLTEDQVRAAVAERNSLKSTSTVKPVKEKSALQKTSEFLLPIATKAANTIGTFMPGTGWKQATDSANTALDMNRRLMEAAKKETDPQKKAFLLNAAKSSQENISSAAQGNVQSMQDNSGLTDEDLKKGGLNARLGFGSALEIGSYLTPQVKTANGATATGRVINAGLTGGAAGTMAGSAKATQADTLGGAAKDVTVGGLAGAGTGAAFQGVLELLGGVGKLSNKVRDKARKKAVDVYRETLKDNSVDEKFYTQAGGRDNVSKKAMGRNFPKTKEGVRKEFERYQPEFEKKVSGAIGKSEKIGAIDVSDEYSKIISEVESELKNDLGNAESRGQLTDALSYLQLKKAEAVGKKTLGSINRERIRIDRVVGKTPVQEVKSGEQMAEKLLSGKLRSLVKNKLPQLKPEFEKYQLLSGLKDAMTKEPKVGIAEIAGASPFAIAGLVQSDPMRALMTMLAGAGLVRAARSPGVRRVAATAMSKYPTVSTRVGQSQLTGILSAGMANSMDRMSEQQR